MTRNSTGRLALWSWVIPLGVAVATFVAFLPALRAGFVAWDDESNFVQNLHYRGLGATQLRWMWTTFLLGHYVPLSWMSLGLDYTIWKMNAAGYHLTNVILHTLNAVLLYFLAKRLLRLSGVVAREFDGTTSTFAAAFAALLFAVHPLRVESVAWVTERRDVLAGFFYLSSLLLYLRDLERRNSRRGWYWLAFGMFVCALLSKATAVTLPAVLLILNVYPLRRLGSDQGWWSATARRVYAEMVPFTLMALATVFMTFVALQRTHQLTVPQKLGVSAYSLAFYLLKSIVPLNLSPLYDMPQHVNPTDAVYLLSYCVAIVITAVVWFARKRRPGLSIGWLLFVVILIPMLGFHQNGPQIAADRYTYNAAPVLAILVAAGWASLRRPLSVVPAITATTIILVLGVLTWNQTEVWHDSLSMWSHVLSLNGGSSVTLTALGNLSANAGKTDDAINYFERSLAIDPDSPEAENNLGIALSREHRFAEAMHHYQRAAELKPGYYEAENNIGLAIAEQGGDLTRALDHYRVALAMNPDYADAHVNWGNALVLMGRFDDAVGQYREALRIRPDDADAERNWGVALARQNNFAGAVEHFRRALALRPDFPDAKQLLDRAEQLQREREGRAPLP